MHYKAVIFDLDGVICSTDEYHYLAWKSMASKIGVPFNRALNDRLRGISRMESLDIILEQHQGTFTRAEKVVLAEQKNEIFKKYLAQMSPTDLSSEVKETLNALRQREVLLAIGSSSKNASFILDRIGLHGYFNAVLDGNGITHSKPDPEVFLKAALMLNIQPKLCLVVEDAISGAKAGHDGGMDVACIGDAAKAGVGKYQLNSFRELLDIVGRVK